MEREARLRIQSSADIVAARQQGRQMAAELGFQNATLTLIATAISEVARNMVEYAKHGEVFMTHVQDGPRKGIRIVLSDKGPGIADLSAVMRDGFSTGRGLGVGLPGAKRLMDDFEIVSELGEGTTVTMTKWTA